MKRNEKNEKKIEKKMNTDLTDSSNLSDYLSSANNTFVFKWFFATSNSFYETY